MANKKLQKVSPTEIFSEAEVGQIPFPAGMRRKRSLTLEVKSITKMGYVIFTCQGELVTSEMPSKFSKTGKAEATSVDVTDRTTGEAFTLVLNAVATSALRRAGTPLAGRHFEVSVGSQAEGKRYRDTEVNELEDSE